MIVLGHQQRVIIQQQQRVDVRQRIRRARDRAGEGRAGAGRAGANDGADGAVGGDAAQAMVAGVRQQDHAGAGAGERGDAFAARVQGRAAVACETAPPAAGDPVHGGVAAAPLRDLDFALREPDIAIGGHRHRASGQWRGGGRCVVDQ